MLLSFRRWSGAAIDLDETLAPVTFFLFSWLCLLR
jgi:hypothetical protein